MSPALLAALAAVAAVLALPRPEPSWPANRTSGPPVRWRPLTRRRARRAAAASVAEALQVLDALGPALRVGLAPVTALDHLAAIGPGDAGLARELAIAARQGVPAQVSGARASPVGSVWARACERTGAKELELVAAAWTLADTSGVALADAVELGARLLRESRSRRARLQMLLAGPKATMTLLTTLPLAGPAVGLLFGISPAQLYAGSVLSLMAAICGLALVVVGRLWCRVLVRRALAAGERAQAPQAAAPRGRTHARRAGSRRERITSLGETSGVT